MDSAGAHTSCLHGRMGETALSHAFCYTSDTAAMPCSVHDKPRLVPPYISEVAETLQTRTALISASRHIFTNLGFTTMHSGVAFMYEIF